MILTGILLGVILMLLLLSVVLVEWPSFRVYYMTRHIEGPWAPPIIGAIHIVLAQSSGKIMDLIQVYHDIYKRFVLFPLGGIYNIIIKEPNDVQVVLGSSIHIQKGKEYQLIAPWLNEGLLLSDGSKWSSRRKLLTPTFHFRILEDSMSGINKSTTILVDKLAETNGTVTQVEKYITRCTLDIIGDTAMGINLEAQSGSGASYLQNVKSVTEAMILRILTVWQFHDFIFNLSRRGRQFFRNLKVLHNFTDKTIKERKQTYKEKEFSMDLDAERKARKPFLDCLLETQKDHPDVLSDLDIREEVDTFMFEGHDTTSTAISFALWLLGSNSKEQEKVYKELMDIFGNEDRDVTMADIHNMVYLEKVIKETLRLYPSVPYISRRFTEDCIFEDGAVLPAGVNVVILPYFLHRDKNYFSEPEKFNPERFSEDNMVGRHPFCYIPFSAGPRNCIGQKFAMLEMKVTLAKILKKLSVTAVTKKEEFKLLPYLIIRPTKPLMVKFILRPTKVQ